VRDHRLTTSDQQLQLTQAGCLLHTTAAAVDRHTGLQFLEQQTSFKQEPIQSCWTQMLRINQYFHHRQQKWKQPLTK